MKFSRVKQDGLDGQTEVIFSIVNSEFRIKANGQGISFRGESPTIESAVDLQVFAKTVSDAWRDHMSLKPRIFQGFQE